jgi:hypothetical protein
MESAITEAFLKTVRGLSRKYAEDVETEATKFALVLKTLYSSAAVGSPVAADDVLQHRVNMLESVVDRLVQEVGDMDGRVAYTERLQADDMWHADGEPLSTNEVVDMSELVQEPVHVVKTGGEPAPAPVPVPAPAPAPAPAPVPAPVPAPAPVAVVEAPAPIVSTPEPVPSAEEGEENEEEEEEAALEEFEFEGKTYYKDEDNNIYTTDDDGDIDPNPVGRWLTKSQKIKFFSKQAS